MNSRLDAPSTAPQTPLEGDFGPTLDGDPESVLQSRPENPESSSISIQVDKPCIVTIQSQRPDEKKVQSRPVILAYADYARFEGIPINTVRSRIRSGLPRVELAERGRNGKPVWGIPFEKLSASGQARYWQAKRQQVDSTADLTGDGGSHGLAAPMGQGMAPSRQALIHDVRGRLAEPTSLASPTALASYPVGGASVPRVALAARGIGGGDEHLSPAPPSAGPPSVAFNDAGVPVLASDPRLVWEAGLQAAFSEHACEEFFRRRRAVAALDLEQAVGGHGDKLDLARRVADQHRLKSWRTLLTWQRHVRKHGEQRLVPRWKKSTGSKTIPKHLQGLLEAFYAQGGAHDELNRPSVRQCHAQMLVWFAGLYGHLAKPPKVPSYDAVNRFIAAIRKARPMLVESAREGKDFARDHFGFHVIRDPKAIGQGVAVVLDHRVMDTHVILPNGKIGRPWLTAIMEIYTSDFAWVLDEQVSSDGVASAFRRWIQGYTILDEETGEVFEFPAHGVPEHAIVDHGKEFHGGPLADRVQVRGGRFCRKLWHSPKDMVLDPGYADTLFSGLGIHRSTATPYLARAKGIEPMFGSFATRIENLIAGHCGRNTVDKPDQLAERRDRGELLTWTQYLVVLSRCIQQWRTERPIGKLRELPPAEYWADWSGPLPDPRRLDNLLLHKEAKRVQGSGIEISHGKETYHYISDDPEFAYASGSLVDALWTKHDPEACLMIGPLSGKAILCPRVDLRAQSWDLLLGKDVPANHRLVNRARGAQNALRHAYKRWGSQMRSTVNADPTGSLRLADANGRGIRQIARELRRAEPADSAASTASGLQPTADVAPPSALYREAGRNPADLFAALDAIPVAQGATEDAAPAN